jgi:hypothetical protein
MAHFPNESAPHTEQSSLKRELEGAKLKPNLPLDALRKDFAQRAPVAIKDTPTFRA